MLLKRELTIIAISTQYYTASVPLSECTCMCKLVRDRDRLRSDLESMKKSLLEQESREALVKEQLDKSTKEVSWRWFAEAQLGFPS